MPRRVRSRRVVRKRRVARKAKRRGVRRSNAGGKITVQRLFGGGGIVFPDILKLNCRMTDVRQIAGTSGQTWLLYKGNSVHYIGPGVTNAAWTTLPTFNQSGCAGLGYLLGPQGSSFATASEPYLYYRVIASSINAKFVNGSSSNNLPMRYVVFPTTEPLNYSSTSWSTLVEQPFAKHGLISSDMVAQKTVSHRANTMKMWGLRYKSMLEDTQYSASYGADPDFIWYWVFLLESADQATAQPTLIDVSIKFTLELFACNTFSSPAT